MFDKAFILEFKKEVGIDQLTDLVKSLSTKVEELSKATDLKTYTLKEAEAVSGINWQAIRKLCIDGRLKHLRSGTKYLIPHRSLREYMELEIKINASYSKTA